MAKKQTRRCVSLNRNAFDAAKQEAANRGMTLAALVEEGLAAIGVSFAVHPQQTPELAQKSAARRAESQASPSPASVRRPSREREVLGDRAADAYGFA
jgi:hypothetical protein